MENNVLLYQKIDRVAVLTLNRPAAYNSINKALMDGLIARLQEAEQDPEVRALVLTGSGEKAFCAGLDLKALAGGETIQDDRAWLNALTQRKKPMLGAINGFAITGGLELALACDLLYASETAVFADTHGKVGILPAWGMSQRLPRLIGYGRAKEMSLSGRKIDAATALAWGLVNRVFPGPQLLEESIRLASEIAAHPPGTVQNIKYLIDSGAGLPLSTALSHERNISLPHNAALDFSDMQAKLKQMKGK